MGTCDSYKGYLEIDIGDYENQLKAWNRQNMLDYQMQVNYETNHQRGRVEGAVITVKNGNPESSDPPEWIEDHWDISTVPDFYSLIKEVEKNYRDWHKESNNSYFLKARYNPDYHCPCEIVSTVSWEKSGGKGGGWLESRNLGNHPYAVRGR
jgi:hypothetical protein